MTAIVFLFTIVFSLYIPATRGFFNIGETGVYLAAVIGGPIVGAIAGGVGSMLADIYLGYTVYAPATLIVKGLEGFIVGYLFRRLRGIEGLRDWRAGLIGSFILSSILVFLGVSFYVGEGEVSLAFTTTTLNLSMTIWIAGGIAIFIIGVFLSYRIPEYTPVLLSAIPGGLEMVLGYFLYEQFILGYPAIVEVPYNIMQMLIGLTITGWVYTGIKRYIGL